MVFVAFKLESFKLLVYGRVFFRNWLKLYLHLECKNFKLVKTSKTIQEVLIFLRRKKRNDLTTTAAFHKKTKSLLSLLPFATSFGINIPHYCYHNNLSISGNCRVCVVEIIGLNKPVISCSLLAKPTVLEHEVYYGSVLVKKSRENVVEFLLINHPLDCPVCDQGSRCDLQDQSISFGFVKRRFYKFKRFVSNKGFGPVIKTVMTRCIHCTRCVRFFKEVAGLGQIGLFNRGEKSEIGTYTNRTLISEISANVIDLCPVGFFAKK